MVFDESIPSGAESRPNEESKQDTLIEEISRLRQSIDNLTQHASVTNELSRASTISTSQSPIKVGVYVDLSNISLNGGFGMKFDVLREFACRGNGYPTRLNVYLAYDEERAKVDQEYQSSALDFHSLLRDQGYKVIEKKLRWFTDEKGNKVSKANSDLDLAADTLTQSDGLDRVLLVSGDGDFVQVIRTLQNKGCRVETVAFKNVSHDLRKETDQFFSGYLIPNLLPTTGGTGEWGTVGSRVRGVCYSFSRERGFGFLRYLKQINAPLWITDTRHPDSPYGTAFVHESSIKEVKDQNLKPSDLPNRDVIFEFDLLEDDKGMQAKNLQVVYTYPNVRNRT
jgi:uncharacterized LabA/DUF88 family protein/cold shock CspA family protein